MSYSAFVVVVKAGPDVGRITPSVGLVAGSSVQASKGTRFYALFSSKRSKRAGQKSQNLHAPQEHRHPFHEDSVKASFDQWERRSKRPFSFSLFMFFSVVCTPSGPTKRGRRGLTLSSLYRYHRRHLFLLLLARSWLRARSGQWKSL